MKNNIWKGDTSVWDSTKRISDQAKLNGDSVTNSLKVTDLFIYSFIGFFFCEYNGYCIVCSIYMILFSSTIELLAGEAEDIYIDLWRYIAILVLNNFIFLAYTATTELIQM